MIWRLIVIVVLGIAGLLGLGMSLCGGMFTLSGLGDLARNQGSRFPLSGMLFISVPSLIAGLLIVVVVVRTLRQQLGRLSDAAHPERDERR